jgi:hypothetical protein
MIYIVLVKKEKKLSLFMLINLRFFFLFTLKNIYIYIQIGIILYYVEKKTHTRTENKYEIYRLIFRIYVTILLSAITFWSRITKNEIKRKGVYDQSYPVALFLNINAVTR